MDRVATPLADLLDTSQRVSGDSSRRAKISHIAQFLRGLAHDEVEIGVAYLSGNTRQGRTGIGYSLLRDARTTHDASAPALAMVDVDRTLQAIAAASGSGSTKERGRLLRDMMARATPREQDFVVRLIVGELRQGALQGVMIEAVAAASGVPAARVRKAAMVAGGIAAVAADAVREGAAGLARYSIAMFQPLAPMLAQPADDIDDALSRIAVPALEWKLDGARVQVHKAGDEVRIYSRTGKEVTPAAPEIVEAMRGVAAGNLILDGEAIALTAGGAPCPFQETMSRFGRVQDVDAIRAKMPLSVFFFDCLRCDDADLTAATAGERFVALAAALPSPLLTPRLVTSEVEAARDFYDDAVARGHEGVMVKDLDAPYEPGARSPAWLKVKRSHTLDLVVLAAEWGHGRRDGWLSNLHLGARDERGGFVMLGKTFKGMTDAMLAWQTEELLKREVERDEWTVYVRPELVVEVTFNDLQASPRYPGRVALRFARVKGYRPDKHASEADTMSTIRGIYARQQGKGAA